MLIRECRRFPDFGIFAYQNVQSLQQWKILESISAIWRPKCEYDPLSIVKKEQANQLFAFDYQIEGVDNVFFYFVGFVSMLFLQLSDNEIEFPLC